MGMSGRHGVLLFTGGIDIAFGVVFIFMGAVSVLFYPHGAVGVPMWAGIGFIMVGIGNIIAVLTSSKKRSRDYLSINLGSLVLNMVGMILGACVIGFFTWGAWPVLELGITTATEDLISIYTSIILMAVILFIMSLMAMFMDCCSYALFGGAGHGQADYYGPPRPRYYDGQYGPPPPAHIYKP